MKTIHVLDSATVDKIAAGEVVERPCSIVKELVENSIDAEATIITVEIKEGGKSLIRVTDNGIGINKNEITKVFLRHATSKIQTSDDLFTVQSLGFRGEALSSISAVCQVELITKTEEAFVGTRIYCAGGIAQPPEEVGAPDGTTIVARNIFFNTPVRQKFLKSAVSEAGYISDLIQRIALSRPDISFKFIHNGQTKFYTSGNGNICEVVYRLYGRETADNLVYMEKEEDGLKVSGYLGKPVLNRSTRSFETFFVNGRYIKSQILSKCVEEGYQEKLMQHKYPFVVLYFTVDPQRIDVNVHPTKMDIRIERTAEFSHFLIEAVKESLLHKEFLVQAAEISKPSASVVRQVEKEMTKQIPEPFETNRLREEPAFEPPAYQRILGNTDEREERQKGAQTQNPNIIKQKDQIYVHNMDQLTLFEDSFFETQAKEEYAILGQIFNTYWLLTLGDKLFIMDQHAAHEKVKYEAFMKQLKEKTIDIQNLNPPVIITMTQREQAVFEKYKEHFQELGFIVEEFGGDEFAIRGVPNELYGYHEKELFLETLDELLDFPVKGDNQLVLSKIASMSCKAAVKGNQRLSCEEAKRLVDTLFTLENPYHCPHGRPTIISMSKYEIEKKFKRVVT